jgi:mannitol/fructose-specific phosphotransferase system IIA component (Ntr-type)
LILTDLLTPDGVRVPLAATDKAGVLRELTELLAGQLGVDANALHEAVLVRERRLSTGIGHGIAIPHAKSALLDRLYLVCGSAPAGIEFGSLDGAPVRLFFLLMGPESAAGDHVKALSQVAGVVRRESLRQALVEAETPEQFRHVLQEGGER